MTHVKLIHNPYLNKTEISINDEQILSGPLFDLTNMRRLQVWLEDFFPYLYEHCNDNTYQVFFGGIEQDFHDLEEISKTSDYDISLKYISEEQAHPDWKTTRLKELFEEAKKGPIDEFKTDEIDKAFQRAISPEFEICVVATMSAGKSTLINAILGQDLQPSENKACTATVTTVKGSLICTSFGSLKCTTSFNFAENLTAFWSVAEKSCQGTFRSLA